MNKRRMFIFGITALAIGLSGVATNVAEAQSPAFLTMRGGGSAGSWYIGSAIISTIVNRDVEDTIMTATLGAGNRNIIDVDKGSAQYGFAVGRSAVEGYEGIGNFDAEHNNIRAMMSLFPLTLQIVARRDSGIETFDDLIGKRVSAGQKGFTTLGVITELLKLKGHTIEDIDHYYLNYGDANQQLQDGQLDAVVALTGYPNPPYSELESLFPINLVSLDEDLVERFTDAFPGYSAATVPATAYPSWGKDTLTFASPTLMIVNQNQPEEQVYVLTKTIFENRGELAGAAAPYRHFQPESVLDGIDIPLHPGAERYWREQDLLK